MEFAIHAKIDIFTESRRFILILSKSGFYNDYHNIAVMRNSKNEIIDDQSGTPPVSL